MKQCAHTGSPNCPYCADNARLREMITEAVKYCVEDKAETKRTTRLARWVARAKEETKP